MGVFSDLGQTINGGHAFILIENKRNIKFLNQGLSLATSCYKIKLLIFKNRTW
jgi:hypothetical protein